MVPERACTVSLDPRFYKKIQDFEARFPNGVPSIKDAQSLTVEGDWTFGADVVVATGEAHVEAEGSPGRTPTAPGSERIDGRGPASCGWSLRGGAGHSVMRSGATARSGNEKTLALPEEDKREGTAIRWAILESNQ